MVPLDELDAQRRPVLRRLALALIPAVAFVVLLGYGLMSSGSSEVKVGGDAPAFELPKLEGGTLSSDDLRDSPVVVNFWASWCVPCREEAPLLERTWRRYRDQGVVILGVNIQDAKSDAKGFVREFDITYPVVRDVNQELVRRFGVTGIPETFFIDHTWRFTGSAAGSREGQSQGTVVLGAIAEDELVSNVENLIRRASSSDGAGSR